MGENLDFDFVPLDPEAVQIVNIEDHALELDSRTAKQILEAYEISDRKVVVVSIAGSLRKGKSFLLNFFLKYLNAQYKKHNVRDWIGRDEADGELSGFKWRGGKDRETVGIWMWSEVFTYDYEKGDRVAIILMDTQGIFDNESSLKDCISVFAISMLLSSVQCYNIMRGVQEDDLQHLELFMEYAQLAMEDDINEKPFQKLLFIIRDWPFPYDNDYGYSQKYIDGFLEEKDTQTEEMRKLRENIKSSFNEVNAFLLPYPGKNVAQQKDFKGNVQVIDDEFLTYVEQLVPSIFAPENLILKQISGEPVTAHVFARYLEGYVEAFKGEDMPTPRTILAATAEVHVRQIYEKCLKQYTDRISAELNKLDGYFEAQELQQIQEREMVDSMSKFRNTRKLGGELLLSEWEEKLQKAIRQENERFREINKSRENGVETTRSKITKWVAGSAAVVAGVAAVAVAGPLGAGIYFAEAGNLLMSGIVAGSTAGGGTIGAAITKFTTSFMPKRWFRNRNAEIAVNPSAGTTVATASPVSQATGMISRFIETVQNELFSSFFPRR